MKIVVTRPFFWNGQSRQLGDTLDVSKGEAAELASYGKAKPASDESMPVAPSGPMTTEIAHAFVRGKGGK